MLVDENDAALMKKAEEPVNECKHSYISNTTSINTKARSKAFMKKAKMDAKHVCDYNQLRASMGKYGKFILLGNYQLACRSIST